MLMFIVYHVQWCLSFLQVNLSYIIILYYIISCCCYVYIVPRWLSLTNIAGSPADGRMAQIDFPCVDLP